MADTPLDETLAVIAARFGVIETMLRLMLVELVRTAPDKPEIALERLRTMFWDAGPSGLSSRPENEMRAFRREWDKRVDFLFDDAARILKNTQG